MLNSLSGNKMKDKVRVKLFFGFGIKVLKQKMNSTMGDRSKK
jgi:hypothetical protein